MSPTHVERWKRVMVPNYNPPPLLLSHGKGTSLWDAAGRQYLDFFAGVAVCSTGHAHPRVAEAVSRQAQTLLHTSNLYAHENVLRLAEELTSRTGYEKAFFCNSGAEANEFALKLVRRHANRKGVTDGVILSFERAFHGRTLATVTLTGTPKYQKDFAPLPSGFVHLPYNDLTALRTAFDNLPVIGVFLEFVQGEGGVNEATFEFAEEVRHLCTERGALLVADEVQTGVGRTGKFLSQEHYGVRADVVTLAKGLGSGLPIGAGLTTSPLAELLQPGDHGTTFGGNPVATAAALATLQVLDHELLTERAGHLGEHFQQELRTHLAPWVKDVRGKGLLVGVEFTVLKAADVKKEAERLGLIVGTAGDNVLRLAPPLIVTREECERAAALLEKACANLAAGPT
ncbi:MAG TPA: acetylornithine transaminase [Candidatus Thermoplasmatota archaeon]|nr:acetylornithine transaminase [Candidatus Thermoplasmatota archaeon]